MVGLGILVVYIAGLVIMGTSVPLPMVVSSERSEVLLVMSG